MSSYSHLITGLYTQKEQTGINVYRFDPRTAETEHVWSLREDNPSFHAADRRHGIIYAVLENPAQKAYLISFRFDALTGGMEEIGRVPTGGDGPCHICLDPTGVYILVSNYGSGTIAVFRSEEGRLTQTLQIIGFEGSGPVPDRQEGSHPHCCVFTPGYDFVMVCDLGTDSIYRFDFDTDNVDAPVNALSRMDHKVTSGSGPRHLVFDLHGRHAYLINELSGTVAVFKYDNGVLTMVQELPTDMEHPPGGAEIVLAPDGKYLYASNRDGNDGIALFTVTTASGLLNFREYFTTGLHPRMIALSPDGEWLLSANRDSDHIAVYRPDIVTGELQDTGRRIVASMPVCMLFV